MKKHYLTLLILLLLIPFSDNLLAQESENNKQKEVYLNGDLIHLTNLGLQYKTEIKNKTYFRLGLADFSFNYSKNNPGSDTPLDSKNTSIHGRFELGLEKRKQIVDKLDFFYGMNLMVYSEFHRNITEDPALPRNLRYRDIIHIEPGLSFNSGFLLHLSSSFSISAEIIPQIIYTYYSSERIEGSEKVKDINNGVTFSANNRAIRFSLIYNWEK
jgi:hypothetical protein